MTLQAARIGVMAKRRTTGAASIRTHTKEQDFTNVHTTSTSLNTLTGSTFVIAFFYNTGGGATLSSVSDNKSNTYASIGTEDSFAGSNSDFYYCANALGGSGHTFTFTTSSNTNGSMLVAEITGVVASALDKSQDWNFNALSPFVTLDTATLAQANEIAISVFRINSLSADSYTWGNGFTVIEEFNDGSAGLTGSLGYKVLSSTAALHGTISASVAASAIGAIATFKAA